MSSNICKPVTIQPYLLLQSFNMFTRVKQVVNKFRFCLHISNDVSSFFKLAWRSKQFKWRLNNHGSNAITHEAAETYNFKLNKKNLQISLRTHSGDIAIFYEVFWQHVYKLPVECYNDARTIVDLGANIGLASIFFRLASPMSVIYAVEPEPGNYQLLLTNLHADILYKKTIPLQAAIDLEDGEASIQIKAMRYNSGITKLTNGGNLVRTLSMNTLLKEFSLESIDILKVDIEGMEKRLFEGDLAWLDKVHHILIEFHSEAIKASCVEVLLSRGFILQPVKTGNLRSNVYWAKNVLKN